MPVDVDAANVQSRCIVLLSLALNFAVVLQKYPITQLLRMTELDPAQLFFFLDGDWKSEYSRIWRLPVHKIRL